VPHAPASLDHVAPHLAAAQVLCMQRVMCCSHQRDKMSVILMTCMSSSRVLSVLRRQLPVRRQQAIIAAPIPVGFVAAGQAGWLIGAVPCCCTRCRCTAADATPGKRDYPATRSAETHWGSIQGTKQLSCGAAPVGQLLPHAVLLRAVCLAVAPLKVVLQRDVLRGGTQGPT
jgi:hypothetical protein